MNLVKVDGKTRKERNDEVDSDWMNHQLFQMLCLNLKGKALKSVQLLDDPEMTEVNGIIGWCKLAYDTSAMTSQRLQGLADQVYAPRRCKKYGDVLAAIEEWELVVKMFENTEKDMKLSEQTRIYSIRKIVPEELENDIIRSSTLTTFDAVRKYINEQVTVRRDKKSASGPVSMDANLMQKTLAAMVENGGEGYGDDHEVQGDRDYGYEGEVSYAAEEEPKSAMDVLMSFVKGYKGGGKDGKSKGKGFDGNCHHCGIRGHRIADCWKKTEEMKGKGKGKDGAPGPYGSDKGKGKGFGFDYKGGKGYGYDSKGSGGWKGSGKGFGKGGYGKAYNVGQYEEAASQAAWTLSLSKVKVEKPPGLNEKVVISKNPWSAFDMPNEETHLQRKEDMEDLANCYENEYPHQRMGNYSKNQVRQMQGEEKKVRFTSIPKANAKVVPLNMFVKKVDRIGTETGVKKCELIGMKADGIGMKKYDPTAMTASNGKVTQPFGGTVTQHCGGHHCPGYDATCRSLSAGVFKAPGGCSEDETNHTSPMILKIHCAMILVKWRG